MRRTPALTWNSPEQKAAEFRAARCALRLSDGNPAHAGTVLPRTHKYYDPASKQDVTLSYRFFIDNQGVVYAKAGAGILENGAHGDVTIAETENSNRFVVKEVEDRKYGYSEVVIGAKFNAVVDAFKTQNERNDTKIVLVLKYLGMDLVEYLNQLHQSGKTLSDNEQYHLASELSRCLYEMHRAGYAHRDVKLENFTIDENGKVHLIDFGLASKLNERDELRGTLRTLTPQYHHRSLEAIDVFALLRSLYLPHKYCTYHKRGVVIKTHDGRPGIFLHTNEPIAPIFTRVNLYNDNHEHEKYPTALQVYATTLLIKHGVNIHAYDLEDSQLILILDALTPENGEINWEVVANHTLYSALKQNNTEVVEKLLPFKPDFFCIQHHGYTVIQLAANTKRWDIVFEIASKYHTNEDDDAQFGSALLNAANANETKTAIALLNAQAHTSWCFLADDYVGYHAIHCAIKNNNFELVSAILKKDLDAVNCTKKEGPTPLAVALTFNNSNQIITFLVNNGADINHPSVKKVLSKKITGHLYQAEKEIIDLNNKLNEKLTEKNQQLKNISFFQCCFFSDDSVIKDNIDRIVVQRKTLKTLAENLHTIKAQPDLCEQAALSQFIDQITKQETAISTPLTLNLDHQKMIQLLQTLVQELQNVMTLIERLQNNNELFNATSTTPIPAIPKSP